MTEGLRADPAVAGAALVGSLGTGRHDDWSDVDLLVVVDDGRLDDYARRRPAQRAPRHASVQPATRHRRAAAVDRLVRRPGGEGRLGHRQQGPVRRRYGRGG
ncbi:nucleotidyltransferase domain-containing protein [Jiangella rhizosphaerae]|uniref:nucleotidyltransferase domain-containing protein n=1 Tax=Jiangella rhizosphaerae TaxID=2293569 RepID=UPI0013146C30|nr:nucleotidyltransferase domain-containing protein [Jiangella rhizosphaerae]